MRLWNSLPPPATGARFGTSGIVCRMIGVMTTGLTDLADIDGGRTDGLSGSAWTALRRGLAS